MENVGFYSFCRPARLLHDTALTHPLKLCRFWTNGEPRPKGVSIQERQERPVVGWLRVAVGVEAGSVTPYWMGSGARPMERAGTDTTGSLVAKKRMSFEVETLWDG